MTVQSLYNRFAKDIAEQLAGYGFERDRGGRIFRRSSPHGDVLVVELQSSDHSTKQEKRFYINVALVLGPKWESDNRRRDVPGDRLPDSSHGSLLRRIRPIGSGEDQWSITDERSCAEASEQARRSVDATMPDMLRLLDRDHLFAEAPQIFKARAWRVRAWLLADRGPSEELDRLLEEEGARRDVADLTARIRDHANSRVPQEGA